jgi:hypothetical protein
MMSSRTPACVGWLVLICCERKVLLADKEETIIITFKKHASHAFIQTTSVHAVVIGGVG